MAERLAARLEAHCVLEEWGQNPFLKAFYDGSPGAAFQAELFFLLSRYRQQQELLQRRLFSQCTILDYVFEKSKLFAYLNLEDSELLIYEKLYALLGGDARPGPTWWSTCRRPPRCSSSASASAGGRRRAISPRSTWPK